MEWAGFAKHTLTLGTSTFDIGSDIINGLTFLGYYNPSPSNETSTVSNVSTPFGNQSFMANTFDTHSNVTTNKYTVHEIWGILSLLIVILPGIVVGFPFLLASVPIAHKNFNNILITISVSVLVLPLCFLFPITLLAIQLGAIIQICRKAEIDQVFQMFIIGHIGVESSVESSCQLLLQIFTILYGYESTPIQKITILSIIK